MTDSLINLIWNLTGVTSHFPSQMDVFRVTLG